ncbi:AAA family ATPase [Vibrio parahaemolyticus]|uniref:AAA family ATPase n=1 Tax=Vibrio parahaemolyticus TaxID=670 RepID=UPI0028088BAB|nr:ATP-binding protein [Vibrio parahaemolyticus]
MNTARDWHDRNPYFIKTVEVSGLLSRKNVRWDLGNVNVLVGQNGSGKSTILDLVRFCLLGPDYFDPSTIADKFSSVTVTFNNGMQSTCNITDPEEHEHVMLDTIRSLLDRSKENGYTDPELEKLERLYKTISTNRPSENTKQAKVQSFATGKNDFITNDGGNELLRNVNVEYISTFDMILMSKEEQDQHSDELGKYSQLDILISKELSKLSRLILKKNNKTFDQYNLKFKNSTKDLYSISVENTSQIRIFVEKLNEMFAAEKKSFFLDNTGWLVIECNGKKINHKLLSSGEKQLLYILLKTVNTSDKASILLLDEPEISMHLGWQEQLIGALRQINPSIQIVAVSHSPALVMKGWLNCLSDIKNITINS